MRCVALMRNVNQGQRGHPSTVDLVDAFTAAGARNAEAFQSNGTLVFDADEPNGVVDGAEQTVAAGLDVSRDAFWVPFADLERIVAAHAGAPDAARREFTLHGGGVLDSSDVRTVRAAADRRCAIVDAGAGWCVTVNEVDRESNATPVVERITGGAATSRGIPTLARLTIRFSQV